MDSPRHSDAIEMTAADWLARRDGGTWSDADETAFRDWQSEFTAHRLAVIRLKTIWQQADRLQALGAGVPKGTIPPPGEWRISPLFERKRTAPAIDGVEGDDDMDDEEERAAEVAQSVPALEPPRRFARIFEAISQRPVLAAGIALAILTAGIVSYVEPYEPGVYRTAVGDSQAVHLSDGSHVTLNTDSKIHVALDESERRIELDRGEAFFEVAKDAARPFVVWAANKRIVAVGTKFSVLRAGDDVRVVVTEGRVRLEEIRHAMQAPVQLDAGGVAQAGAAGVLVKDASVAEVEKYVSWRDGYLAFHDTPLAQAVAEFNRYHRIKLVVADPALADLRIGGNLRTTNMEAFVRVLEQGFPVRAKDDGDRILLTPR